jgi:hypothetical protein
MTFVDKRTGRQAAVERRKTQRDMTERQRGKNRKALDRGNCNKILDITIYNTSL